MWLECRFQDTETDGSNTVVVSLGMTIYPHCFSQLSCEMIPGGDNLVKGVQCYELFGGIALKNHAFFKL